mmetsp:Transcript_9776/g.21182  ORF Transcript_9776/g.21182 Transcript_9776/m.21182 type:complete len:132 (-) Transcript_9776:238-633(-)
MVILKGGTKLLDLQQGIQFSIWEVTTTPLVHSRFAKSRPVKSSYAATMIALEDMCSMPLWVLGVPCHLSLEMMNYLSLRFLRGSSLSTLSMGNCKDGIVLLAPVIMVLTCLWEGTMMLLAHLLLASCEDTN